MKKNTTLLRCVGFGLLIILGTGAINVQKGGKPTHDNQKKITIPFNIKNNTGKTLLSDAVEVHVADSPVTITKTIQNKTAKKFLAMSEEERVKIGGVKNYGLEPQRWTVYQGTKIFKMFSKEQELIDNYDRLDKKFHTFPLTVTYLIKQE